MNVHVDVEEGADHSMKAIQWSEHPPGLFKMARRKHFTLYTTTFGQAAGKLNLSERIRRTRAKMVLAVDLWFLHV
ncbi:hypothetical protein T4C_1938 [Trichinella pseudospiralis]|uniref:Uncharacterized protein n=1 Tax=Trichinella pseudospiralis TaxID=6337 RepID=A0A0V1JLG6_TRIPS|nr:hypothetical protein T4C_1938 [Trichinella pseudospiralis]